MKWLVMEKEFSSQDGKMKRPSRGPFLILYIETNETIYHEEPSAMANASDHFLAHVEQFLRTIPAGHFFLEKSGTYRRETIQESLYCSHHRQSPGARITGGAYGQGSTGPGHDRGQKPG
jgi:hypothetical protein